jgi:transcriptional regulator with XRE-family HTH domain
MSRIPLNPLGSNSLGDYLREQRQSARLSLRQLAELAGVSNPYLSQIERGLKKPSAEILQQLAKGLQVSAESLYVRAGILDERPEQGPEPQDTRAVISADPRLSQRQKAALLDIYDSFVGEPAASPSAAPSTAARKHDASGRSSTVGRRSARPTSASRRTTSTKTTTPKK